MRSTAYSNMMIDLFEQLVKNNEKFEGGEEGIYFILEVSSACHGFEKEANTYHEEWWGDSRSYAHVIIIRPHYVFVAITDSYETPKVDEFYNTSNHDSCWRTDGIGSRISRLYYKTYEDAYSNMPEDHRPPPISANMNFRLGHGAFSMDEVFKCVRVKTRRSEGKYRGYDLVEIEIIKKAIEI